jgi:hypothetical protein
LSGVRTYFENYNFETFGWQVKPPDRIRMNWRGIPIQGGVVNDDAQVIFTRILDELADNGYVTQPDPDEWGFSDRNITGGEAKSFHAGGIAIDVDASKNPYVKNGSWRRHTIPDVAGQIAARYGAEWGGDWRSPKDYMHFELHISPEGARLVADRIRAEKLPEGEVMSNTHMSYSFPPGATGEKGRHAISFPGIGSSTTVTSGWLHWSANWVPDDENCKPVVKIWVLNTATGMFLDVKEGPLKNSVGAELKLPSGTTKVCVEVLSSSPDTVVTYDVELLG